MATFPILAARAAEYRIGYVSTRDIHASQWDYLVAGARYANAVARQYDSIASSSSGTSSSGSSNRVVLEPAPPTGFEWSATGDVLSFSWSVTSDYGYYLSNTCEFQISTEPSFSAFSLKTCVTNCWLGFSHPISGYFSYEKTYYARVRKKSQICRATGVKWCSDWAEMTFRIEDTSPPYFQSSVFTATVQPSGTVDLHIPGARDNVGVEGIYVEFTKTGQFDDSSWGMFVNVNDKTTSIPFLDPSAIPYRARVRAFDSNGNVSSWLETSFTIPLDPLDQRGPDMKDMTASVNDRVVTAKWDLPEDESGIRGYRVQIGSDSSFSKILEEFYTDRECLTWKAGANLSAAVRVRAQDNKGNWGPWGKTARFDCLVGLTKRIEVLQFGDNAFNIQWSAMEGVAAYEIEVASDREFKTVVHHATVDASASHMTFFELDAEGTFYCRARGVDGNGRHGEWRSRTFHALAAGTVNNSKATGTAGDAYGMGVAFSGNYVFATGAEEFFDFVNRWDRIVNCGRSGRPACAIAASSHGFAAGCLSDTEPDCVYAGDANPLAVYQTLTSPSGEDNGSFGHAVAMDGDILVVGAPDEFDYEGRVHVYSYSNDGRWVFLQTLSSHDNAAFGYSVAMSDEWLFVGSPFSTSDLEDCRGKCCVYRRNGSGQFDLFQEIKARPGTDYFAASLAVSGEWAVIGAPLDASSPTTYANGGAMVFRFDGTRWKDSQYLVPAMYGNGEAGFGRLVDMTDEWIAVAGSGDSSIVGNGGSVVLFHRTGTTWTEAMRVYAPVMNANQFFGESFAIYGNELVVGAPGDGSGGKNAGALFRYPLRDVSDTAFNPPDLTLVNATLSDDGRIVFDTSRLLGDGVSKYEIQLSANVAFDPLLLGGITSNSRLVSPMLVPGDYVYRIRTDRGYGWSEWSENAFVSSDPTFVYWPSAVYSDIYDGDNFQGAWPANASLSLQEGRLVIDTGKDGDVPVMTLPDGTSVSGIALFGIAVFHFEYLSIGAGVEVEVTGSRPLSLTSATDMEIGANIDVSGSVAGRCGGGRGGLGGKGGAAEGGEGGAGGKGGIAGMFSPYTGGSGGNGGIGQAGSSSPGQSGSASQFAYGQNLRRASGGGGGLAADVVGEPASTSPALGGIGGFRYYVGGGKYECENGYDGRSGASAGDPIPGGDGFDAEDGANAVNDMESIVDSNIF
ncbi:MAG: hypothetical protein ILM98_14525 [Kiritimatiellae bacterium]|nr:hypothetical protein [Kiritimatiellia bacterium]